MAVHILVLIKFHCHHFYRIIHLRNPEKFDTRSILYRCILLPWTLTNGWQQGDVTHCGQRCQAAFWIGPQLVVTSDNPAVSEITFCVKDFTASLVIFPSIKKYRLCNKRHTLQIDCFPVVWDSSNTAGCHNREMFLFNRTGPFAVLYWNTCITEICCQ